MNTDKKIFIASDHAGYDLKKFLLEQRPLLDWQDLGPSSDDRVDYPDYAELVASQLKASPHALGVLVCGSGQGMAMAANKHRHIRAALCWNKEVASLARAHNDANTLCLGARLLAPNQALAILDEFLQTAFEGGRHQARVNKMSKETL